MTRSIENKFEWIRNNQSYITDVQPKLKQLQYGIDGNGGEADFFPYGSDHGFDTVEKFNYDSEDRLYTSTVKRTYLSCTYHTMHFIS